MDRASMRLPATAHTSRPWRIHELTAGFRLEDVWDLPTPGGQADFPRLVRLIAAGDPLRGSSRAVRTLWAIRWKAGELLGWDGPVASRGPMLRDRLPADLRDAPAGPDSPAPPPPPSSTGAAARPPPPSHPAPSGGPRPAGGPPPGAGPPAAGGPSTTTQGGCGDPRTGPQSPRPAPWWCPRR